MLLKNAARIESFASGTSISETIREILKENQLRVKVPSIFSAFLFVKNRA